MSFVRTVLGDIPGEEMGVCYAHEHLIIDGGYVWHACPAFRLTSVENGIQEVSELAELGVRTMVDSMPTGAGRNVRKLAEISRRSGVHIVAPTGLHLAQYYPPGHWSESIDEDALVRLFSDEIEQGIDANDANGPWTERTAHRAGVIKVAGSEGELTPEERRNFRAAARAAVATGCPILTHTEQGTAAMEQVDIFREAGVDLGKVVLSHLDRNPDEAHHRDVLATGVRLEYDSAFRWKSGPNHTLRLLTRLYAEFPDQLMLGMDAARPSYWRSYGGSPGLAFLVTDFAEALRAEGLSHGDLERIFVSNPRAAYTFGPASTPT